jgi:hypothetical protein
MALVTIKRTGSSNILGLSSIPAIRYNISGKNHHIQDIINIFLRTTSM